MEKQSKRFVYIRYSYGFLILFTISFFVYVSWLLNRVPPGEARPVDLVKLSRLHSAVMYYYMEYAEIPPEGELKRLLMECNIVVNEKIFYSTPTGKEIRYFTSGNHFVFIASGHNGKYDTPEGYEQIEACKGTGDDYVRFDHVLRNKDTNNVGVPENK